MQNIQTGAKFNFHIDTFLQHDFRNLIKNSLKAEALLSQSM